MRRIRALAEAMEAIQKFGSMIKSPNGSVQSPYLATLTDKPIHAAIACEFGFTPAARSRNFFFDKPNRCSWRAMKSPHELRDGQFSRSPKVQVITCRFSALK